MSAPNAERTLPPRDRSDAPLFDPPAPPVPESPEATVPAGLELEILQLNRLLTEGHRMFGEVRAALESNNWPVAEAKASQLSDLFGNTSFGGLARSIRKKIIAARPRDRRTATEQV